ncbi:MAG: transglycosylase SLT domain-containing protein, partial [Draconibacterium sp.]|nr:transglycosylase SLT domain-containing protein [Draconibacterium sp.]
MSDETPKPKKVRNTLAVLFVILCCIGGWVLLNSPTDNAEAGIDSKEIEKLRVELQQKDEEIKAWKQKDLIQTERIDALERSIKDVNATIEQHIINVNRKVFPQLAIIITEAIMSAEKKYPNIPYSIILAVTELESTFRYTAVSNKDCIGLMQINYKVWLDETNEYNLIKAGILTKKDDL